MYVHFSSFVWWNSVIYVWWRHVLLMKEKEERSVCHSWKIRDKYVWKSGWLTGSRFIETITRNHIYMRVVNGCMRIFKPILVVTVSWSDLTLAYTLAWPRSLFECTHARTMWCRNSRFSFLPYVDGTIHRANVSLDIRICLFFSYSLYTISTSIDGATCVSTTITTTTTTTTSMI